MPSSAPSRTALVQLDRVRARTIHVEVNQVPAAGADRANLEILRDRVDRQWVQKFLKSSLLGYEPVSLSAQVVDDAIDAPWDEFSPESSARAPATIASIFDDSGGALLILGEPGSGKTTSLLDFARELVESSRSSPEQAIPVVLHLSSWNDNRRLFADWVADEINAKYYVSKQHSQNWLEQHRLILLLDGLDEVRPEKRSGCVRAINQFLRTVGVAGVIVCCRRAEYANLAARLVFSCAVCLQPLTGAEIDTYVAQRGASLSELRAALRNDARLGLLAQTPLLLRVMTLAFQGSPHEPVSREYGSSDQAYLRRIFNAYVESSFRRRGPGAAAERSAMCASIKWLATNMRRRNLAVFQIEQLQPSWLATMCRVQTYALVSRLFSGVVLGLAFFASMATGLGIEEWLGPWPEQQWYPAPPVPLDAGELEVPPPPLPIIDPAAGALLPIAFRQLPREAPAERAPVLPAPVPWNAFSRSPAPVPVEPAGPPPGLGLRLLEVLVWCLAAGTMFGLLGGLLDALQFRRQLRLTVQETGEFDRAGEFYPRDCRACCRWRTGAGLALFWLAGSGFMMAHSACLGALEFRPFDFILHLGLGGIGLIWGSIYAFRSSCRSVDTDIRTLGSLGWSWQRAGYGAFLGGVAGTLVGFSICVLILLFMLTLGDAISRAFGEAPDSVTHSVVAESASFLASEWQLILVVVLGSGFVGGLLGFATGGLVPGILRQQETLNQGIRLTHRHALKVGGCVTGALLAVTVPIQLSLGIDALILCLPLALGAGAVVMAWCGGFDVLHHMALRVLLAGSGCCPLKLGPWIERAESLGVVRRAGGSCAFVHRLLLEHFADEDLSALTGSADPGQPRLEAGGEGNRLPPLQ